MADYPDPTLPAPADGVTRGDDKPMPDRGTSAGFTGVGDDRYGADVSVNATNRLGPVPDTGSDAPELRFPKGDYDRFSSSMGQHGAVPGAGVGSAGDSDAPEEDRSEPQQMPMPGGFKEDE